MASKNAQTVLNSLKKNSRMTYALAIPVLIVATVLMAILGSAKSFIPIQIIYLIAICSFAGMAFRQRKLEYWTFPPSMMLKRRKALFVLALVFFAIMLGITLCNILLPQSSLRRDIALPTPVLIPPATVYLSLSASAIFELAYRMKVPKAESFPAAVERERKITILLAYTILVLPLVTGVVAWFGT